MRHPCRSINTPVASPAAVLELGAAMARKTKAAPKSAREAALELVRAWGREGGKKGAKARWADVSAAERSAQAKKAAAARWAKRKGASSP
jgi:hypothetical protein